MRKKLMFMAIVGLASLFVLAVVASAAEWNVPGDFDTIQAAVDGATPGDVIKVEGTFEENVNVTKSLTIDGQGLATLICGIEYWTGKRGDGFRVTASDVTITGFTIIGHYDGVAQDFNNPGIMIGGNYPGDMAHLGVQRVTVSNNVFRDSWSAIYVWKSSNNLITGNTIYDMDWRAVQVYDGSSNAQIEEGYPSKNNKIIDNEIYSSWGGIYVGAWNAEGKRTDNSGTIIQGNHLHDLTDFAVGFGYTNSTNIDISGNTMENNPYGISVFWWGIADLTDTTVTGNTIDSNSYGIIMGTCNQWTIENNEITNNSAVGIYVMESKGIEAHDNKIVDNGLGVYNYIGGGESDQWVVDATLNWWGDVTGPYHPTQWDYMGSPYGPNEGLGDEVSDYVLYHPWKVEGAGITAKLKCRALSVCITPPEDYTPEDIVAARTVSVGGLECVVEGEPETDRHRCKTEDCALFEFDVSDVAECLSGETLVGKAVCVEATLSNENVTCPACDIIEEYCHHGGMR